jgi:hypothetical protein
MQEHSSYSDNLGIKIAQTSFNCRFGHEHFHHHGKENNSQGTSCASVHSNGASNQFLSTKPCQYLTVNVALPSIEFHWSGLPDLTRPPPRRAATVAEACINSILQHSTAV